MVRTHGGWDPDFAQWCRRAVNAAAGRSGPTTNQSAMFWCTIGFLSVILKGQTFRVLAARAPRVAEQEEGLLGRPLSEDPDFWWAPPESALGGGAKKFDMSRGGGSG